MDQVASKIFVGGLEDAESQELIQENEITSIISLTYGEPDGDYPTGATLQKVPMMDGPRNDRDSFRTAVCETIERLEDGERVLIHCSAGASRSVAVAATVLSVDQKLDLAEAFEIIGEKREVANPHVALREQAHTVLNDVLG